MRSKILLSAAALLAVTACETPTPTIEGGQYWQRVNASSAVYTRGPKAQQMLNQDIAACVVEMRELQRLGAIREPLKTDIRGTVVVPNDYGQSRPNPDVPDRNGHLYKELAPYADFDSCMQYKGWERVAWVPYGVGADAAQTYFDSNAVYQHNQDAQQRQVESGANQVNQ